MSELYSELILEHDRAPRNWGRLENASHRADGVNPVCGDQVHVSVRVAGERVDAIKVDGAGCALCRASASLMTVRMEGAKATEARAILAALVALLASESLESDCLGALVAFEAVSTRRMRWKCVTLPFHALVAALSSPAGSVGIEYDTWAMRRGLD